MADSVASVRTQTVEVCAERQLHWVLGDGQPRCGDTHHDHRLVELHQHLDRVVLPNHSAITAVSFAPDGTYPRDEEPDLGLYLDPRWNPPWPHDHLEWPDFGVPADPQSVESALRHLLSLAQSGKQVEVGCLGGHGRTGTAVACLAIISGLPPDQAVDWVRDVYCARAVETAEQATFVETFGATRVLT